MRSTSKLGMLVILLCALVSPAVARAESPKAETGVGSRRVTEGALLWRTGADGPLVPAPVLKTEVDMRVTGMVVRATVRQEFTNPAAAWAEGIYVFPLPEDAAVDHLQMRVDDRMLEGVIQERVAAKTTYEQAKQEGKRASLVEQERPNVFTTSVANIPPSAAIEIEIEYQQTARYDAGEFRLRFPMVVGPRYIPGVSLAPAPAGGSGCEPDTDDVPDASRITPPVRHPALGPINPVSLTIELDPGVPLAQIEAPYHTIQVTPLADGTYRIELGEGSVPADRDFELVWEPAPDSAPAAAMLTEQEGPDVFALLMVMPPASEAVQALRVPREVIFVIDVSGFMHGASIDQARAGLGRGTFTCIGSPAEVQAKMVALFHKLESPALTDVRLELPGVAGAEILPAEIPDLYLGEPVTVTLRAPTRPAHVVLRGRFGAEEWEHELPLHEAGDGAGLSVHWARAKIAALLDTR